MSEQTFIVDTLSIATQTKPRGAEAKVISTMGYIAIAREVDAKGKPTGLVKLDDSLNGQPEVFSLSKWAACFKHAKAIFPDAGVDRAQVEKAIDADFEEQMNKLREAKAERIKELAGKDKS